MSSSSLLPRVVTSFFSTALLAAGLGFLNPSAAYAQIVWDWSFDTEAGTFTTNGSLVGGSAPAATYDISEFVVTSSVVPGALGSLSGGEYHEGAQPGQGFIWDGADPTQFFRDGGNFTNGSDYFLTGTNLRWTIVPASEAESFILDNVQNVYPARGYLTLAPRVPEPATALLLLVGAAGICLPRRRR